MFIICEYAVCILAALLAGTLLFVAGVAGIMTWEAGEIAWRWWRKPASRPNWLMGRWAPEPRLP